MSQSFDAIIIGAGVMGASLAFHLSERGLKAVILERKTVASGATGHSSGLVRMHYDLQVESQLAFESYKYFSNWREKVGGDCGFIRTGFLQIEPRANEEKLRGNVENQKKLGINTLMISANEVKEIAPDFTTDDFDGAPVCRLRFGHGTRLFYMNLPQQHEIDPRTTRVPLKIHAIMEPDGPGRWRKIAFDEEDFEIVSA